MSFVTLDSSEKRFDFGWNRTRVARMPIYNADHSATRSFFLQKLLFGDWKSRGDIYHLTFTKLLYEHDMENQKLQET